MLNKADNKIINPFEYVAKVVTNPITALTLDVLFDKPRINLSKNAINKIHQLNLRASDRLIRIKLEEEANFMFFIDRQKNGDIAIVEENINFIIDQVTLSILKEISIDYELSENQFIITYSHRINSQSFSTCNANGCGPNCCG